MITKLSHSRAGKRIDGAVELEEDGPAVEGELGGVGVRNVDRSGHLARRAVPEVPTMLPGGDVRDDVDLLARLLERPLEREVVVRAHDKLMRCASLPKLSRELGEEAMQRARLDRRLEARVQLVVERPGALHRRDVLRDPGQIDGPVVGHVERARQMSCQVAGAVEAEDRNDPAGKQRLDDLGLLVRCGGSGPRSREPGLVPEDLRLEPLELGSRLDAQLLDEPVSSLLIRLESLRLAARAIESEHQLPARGLAQRVLAHERLELPDDVAVATELEVGLDPFLEGDET